MIGSMKTTIDIPDQMLKEVMRSSKASTKREAVLLAIEEYNRRNRQREMIKYLGTFKSIMSPKELRRIRETD